eukprot:TRINITY_DN11530_c0_g1_i1.p1 TRINITY_DN11530_c0_g1~~TRINITY_DN11530_c0_g1_i1.p1  ORF type:complete len:473 (-),score=144.68 TRINITY_DN11530_c0_g1_i1:126-1496(-)
MADVYKLEWTHSRKTIQTGIGKIMNKEAFMDTIVVCRDGVLSHNKLTLGLVIPDLQNVPAFDIPLEQTILMPDHSVVEIQTLISEMFPAAEVKNATYETKGDEIEVNMDDNNFEHFMENDAVYDTSPRTFGMRRGRGRPPLASASRMPPRFQCDFCHKGFYYKSMLSAHEKLHTGGTRETCEVCGAEYSTRQNLKNHMVKYHGAESFVPRKRGRPPVDPEKRLSNNTPMRARGRPAYKHVGIPRGGHGMSEGYAGGSNMQYEGYDNMDYSNDANNINYSNDAIEYQDSTDINNDNVSSENIITENFLEQNLDGGDSDIAEDDPVIVDPTTEKVEPGASNEYIEVKDDDYKETEGATGNIQMDPATYEVSAKEVSSGSGETSNLNEVSQRPVMSQNLPSDPIEKEYQIELQDVQKLSILTKPELVSICKRNNISVTGEKQALAARILRKLGKIFDDE